MLDDDCISKRCKEMEGGNCSSNVSVSMVGSEGGDFNSNRQEFRCYLVNLAVICVSSDLR